jgi:protein phosphatase 1 regulatory subunit 16A
MEKVASHDELVAEMAMAGKMHMAERLKLAKKRRGQQLKAYAQYEKQLTKGSSSGGSSRKGKKNQNGDIAQPTNKRKLQFTGSILLLDAAARNDVEEGKLRAQWYFH